MEADAEYGTGHAEEDVPYVIVGTISSWPDWQVS